LKVRHVVIRECILRQLPKPHTLYKVDVMTQSDQWAVYRQVNEQAAPFTFTSTTFMLFAASFCLHAPFLLQLIFLHDNSSLAQENA
jgi:hypothetical protein